MLSKTEVSDYTNLLVRSVAAIDSGEGEAGFFSRIKRRVGSYVSPNTERNLSYVLLTTGLVTVQVGLYLALSDINSLYVVAVGNLEAVTGGTLFLHSRRRS